MEEGMLVVEQGVTGLLPEVKKNEIWGEVFQRQSFGVSLLNKN
jgi:hypothetical protein